MKLQVLLAIQNALRRPKGSYLTISYSQSVFFLIENNLKRQNEIKLFINGFVPFGGFFRIVNLDHSSRSRRAFNKELISSKRSSKHLLILLPLQCGKLGKTLLSSLCYLKLNLSAITIVTISYVFTPVCNLKSGCVSS